MSDLAEVLVDYVSGELSAEERARVEARLVADPAFRARAEPLLAAWDVRPSVAGDDARAVAALRRAIVVEGRRPVRRIAVGVAAAVVLVLGGIYGTGMYRIVAPVVAAHQDIRLATGVAELRMVRLPDRSWVTLEPESRVRYRASFFRDVPELTVDGGVTVDVAGPLDVRAGVARIRATSGRVVITTYAEDGDVRVTAVDSSVTVMGWTVVRGTTAHVMDSTVVLRPAGLDTR